MKQKVLNLYGPPCAAKSTIAAYVFSMLKMHGVNCELINEFAKDMSWEKNDSVMSDQLFMFANQWHKMYRCYGQTDLLITDSPLLLSPLYNSDSTIDRQFREIVYAMDDKFFNINYLIKRVVKYDTTGRVHDERQSDQIAVELKKMLDSSHVPYTELPGTLESANSILLDILKMFGKENLTAI